MSSNLLERSGPRPDSASRQRHSPRARRRARESGVDLDLDLGRTTPRRDGLVQPVGAPTSYLVEVDVTAWAGRRPSALYAAVLAVALRALRSTPAWEPAVAGGLGVTVDTPDGPVVLPIPDAMDLNRTALARRIEEGSARAGGDGPGDGPGDRAMFSLVDTGAWGVLGATPGLRAGDLAALALGAVVERPVVTRTLDGDRAIAIRSMAYLVLAVDPVRFDRHSAAAFLRTVQDGLTGHRDET